MLELVLGGARSGKSAFAEKQARLSGLPVVYVATGEARDEEMRARIKRHRQRRPDHWRTVEEPLHLAEVLTREAAPAKCLLVDCLTLFLSNVLLGGAEAEIDRLLAALPSLPGHIVVVSNEVGWGITPANALARRFADEQGQLNQRVAEVADKVTLIAAGLPLRLK